MDTSDKLKVFGAFAVMAVHFSAYIFLFTHHLTFGVALWAVTFIPCWYGFYWIMKPKPFTPFKYTEENDV